MITLYVNRLEALYKVYKNLRKQNKFFTDLLDTVNNQERQLDFLFGLHIQIKKFNLAVVQKESDWRAAVLSVLEAEINNDLNFVFPDDGYRAVLDTYVSRGKIQIDVAIASYHTNSMTGRLDKMQGRLFQQVVSFAALIGVMTLLNIKTVYIDEAFSGSSKLNIKKLNSLLSDIKERGFNIVMIAQDGTMAEGIDANIILLERTLDNKTIVINTRGVIYE